MNGTHEPSAPTYSTVKKRTVELWRGCHSQEDDPREDHSSEAVTSKLCLRDEDKILKSRRIKLRERTYDSVALRSISGKNSS